MREALTAIFVCLVCMAMAIGFCYALRNLV